MHIKIGTRGSKLAIAQAKWVEEQIRSINPKLEISLEIITTKGDKILDSPLATIGGKGLFVKEIEEALLDRRIDLAVHSLKDMPADLPQGLIIAAVPPREDPRDVFISDRSLLYENLTGREVLGTSSLRRSAQIKHRYPNMEVKNLRGNLDTRLRKLKEGQFDGIIVALAGIKRLGVNAEYMQILDEKTFCPAVGQGALAIEMRNENSYLIEIIKKLDHPNTHNAIKAERAFIKYLGGSCQVPAGAIAFVENEKLSIQGFISSIDGGTFIADKVSGSSSEPEKAGIALAEKLMANGGDRILKEIGLKLG